MNEPPTPQPNAPPISVASPLRWLALGWQDLRTNPVPGLLHGVAASAFGMLLWVWAGSQFWWLVGAISALPLLAPVLLVGLLLLSRQAQLGHRAGMREVLQLWMAADLRMVLFGVLMGLAGMAWVLISAGVLLLWAGQPIQTAGDFFRLVVLAQDSALFELWLMFGALLAVPVFASSVVTLPLLLDSKLPLPVAVAHSWRVIALYPAVMVLWALLIACMVGVGLLTGMVGLIVALPWLGHASWHVYVDLKRAGAFGLPGSWGGVQ